MERASLVPVKQLENHKRPKRNSIVSEKQAPKHSWFPSKTQSSNHVKDAPRVGSKVHGLPKQVIVEQPLVRHGENIGWGQPADVNSRQVAEDP